jgi:hypothetical protein
LATTENAIVSFVRFGQGDRLHVRVGAIGREFELMAGRKKKRCASMALAPGAVCRILLAGMSAPLDFLVVFAGHLRSAGIPFAITSGMACVHYGIQQTTKDSDWIIAAEAMEPFRSLLATLETRSTP